MANDTALDEEGITLRQQHQGRFGWLAQTTHPGLAVALSVLSSMPAIEGVHDASHMMYQWVQAHKQDDKTVFPLRSHLSPWKQLLQEAMAPDTPLDEEGITLRQQHQGRFGWLAQTTHPGLAVALSVLSSMPAIVGVMDASHMMYQWVQAHRMDASRGQLTPLVLFSTVTQTGLVCMVSQVKFAQDQGSSQHTMACPLTGTLDSRRPSFPTGLKRYLISRHRARMPRQWPQQTLCSAPCTFHTLLMNCSSVYPDHLPSISTQLPLSDSSRTQVGEEG